MGFMQKSSIAGATRWIPPFVVGLLLRVAVVFRLDVEPGDWVSRTLYAADFLAGTKPLWASTPWPEGNFLLPAVVLAVGGDAFWSVRLLYALLSALAIPAVFCLSREVTDEQAAPYAAWALAFLPFHIFVSANGAMTEGVFITCILVAIYAALRWRRQPDRSVWLLVSGLCIVGAEAFRFEGVLVGACLGLLALWTRLPDGRSVLRSVPAAATLTLFGVICLLYPLSLLWSWNDMFGDPMYMAKYANANTLQFFEGDGHSRWPTWFYFTYSVAFWPMAGPAYVLTPVIWILALRGAAKAPRQRSLFVLLPVVVLTIFYLRSVLSYQLLNQMRYIAPLAVPLLPFVAHGFRTLAERWRRPVLLAAAASFVATQGLTIESAYHDRGVLSRQLGVFSLLKPFQYSAKDALESLQKPSTREGVIVVTPHVVSTWLRLNGGPDVLSNRLRSPSIYRLDDPNAVYTSMEYKEFLGQQIDSARFVAVSKSARTVGLKDGLVKEVVTPSRDVDRILTWNGRRFREHGVFGDIVVLERVPNL